MNDPIKDFVEKHREEFDHLEAPAFNVERLKSRIQPVPEVPKRRTLLMTGRSSWLVAASVMVTLTCAALFYYNTLPEPVNSVPNETVAAAPRPAHKPAEESATSNRPDLVAKTTTGTAQAEKVVEQAQPQNRQSRGIFANLKDSTSASSRLLAILEIEKSGKASNKIMDMIGSTLNHDENTNVRLAALSLLEKHKGNSHVSSILINSLSKQDDPMVQLGLVSLLGKMKNVKIDDKLQALASNPDTFDAVRDEAYNILLNEDKL